MAEKKDNDSGCIGWIFLLAILAGGVWLLWTLLTGFPRTCFWLIAPIASLGILFGIGFKGGKALLTILLMGGIIWWGQWAHTAAPSEPETPAPDTAAKKPAPTQSDNITLYFPGNVELVMVKIPAGSFIMGSPKNERGHYNEKQHRVTLTKDYWLGKYEVTQGQWQAVMGNNPSQFKTGDNYPVENISWDDVRKFCSKLNELFAGKMPEGYRFDLPTEAQWEYACRAGTTTELNSGKNVKSFDDMDEVVWWSDRDKEPTHPVGGKRPNAWGLYDMHGNVGERCRDFYGSYGGDATDPTGPASGHSRVYRGGPPLCRSAERKFDTSFSEGYKCGFRLALVPIQ